MTKDTKAIGQRIQADQTKIIEMYKGGEIRAKDIAEKYNVSTHTIYDHLKRWGVKIERGAYVKRVKKHKHFKRRFSPELKAMMAYNTKVNDEHIGRCKFERSTEEQKLVANIIHHPYF